MQLRAAWLMLALVLTAVSAEAQSHPAFSDDFNRPDGVVGNGWLNTSGNANGNLVVRGNALSSPGPSGEAGVYRQVELGGGETVTFVAFATDTNGFGGLPNRYGTSFLFGNDGSLASGYGVMLYRGDANFNNSQIFLMYNGVALDSQFSTFQFDSSVFISATLRPDRSITGVVRGNVGAGGTFEFSFAPRAIALPGSNFAITMEFPDSRAAILDHPTVDSLKLASQVVQCLTVSCQTPSLAGRDLGTLGGSSSSAVDVNEGGMIVGSSTIAGDVAQHAFVWTEATGMIDLGTLGGTTSTAYTVHDNGTVFGLSQASGDTAWNVFSWTQANGIVNLGPLGTLGGTSSGVRSASKQGVFVGLASLPGDTTYHPFVWTQASGMLDLGTLGVGGEAQSVNKNGMVVGWNNFENDQHPQRAFAWTQALGMIDLGTLGGSDSVAFDLNDNGMVVGRSRTAGDTATRAFSWTQAGGMIDLGTLGGANSQVFEDRLRGSVSNNGMVAGSSETAGDFYSHAFAWTRSGGMLDLGQLGRSSLATIVNDSGMVVGSTFIPNIGDERAFAWTQTAGMFDLGPDTGAQAVNGNGIIVGVRLGRATLWRISTTSISVTTNLATASFSINGPAAYHGSGLTFSVLSAPVGTYSITYDHVACYLTPPSESKQFLQGQTLSFGPAAYLPDPSPTCVPSGTISLSLTMTPTAQSLVVPYSTTPGTKADFDLEVKNNGVAVDDVKVLEDVPSQLTFVSGLVVNGDSCALIANQRVECAVGTLAPGAEASITLKFTVNAGTPLGPITATATITRGRTGSEDAEAFATIGVIPPKTSIPLPLGTDGEPADAFLIVNCRTLAETCTPNGRIAKNRPTVVLTHGLQFAADWSTDIRTLAATLWIFDQSDHQGASALLPLEHCGPGPEATSPTCVNVVQVVWPAAFAVRADLAFDIPDRDEFALARAHAFGASVQIAKLLRDRLGSASGYTGDRVQFVGHSLGTVVNAYTLSLLLPFINGDKVKTLQFTALDRPDRVGKLKTSDAHNETAADFAAQYGFHANFFATALAAGRSGNTKTKIVMDNYYALNSATDGPVAALVSGLGVGADASGSVNIPVYNHPALKTPADIDANVLVNSEGFNDHSGVNQWYRWSMAPDSAAFKSYAYSLSADGQVTQNFPGPTYCHQVSSGFPPFQFTTEEFFRPIKGHDFPTPLLDQSLDPCGAGWGYSILAGDGPPTKAQLPERVDTSLGDQVDVPVTRDLANFRNIHGCTLSDSYNIVCAEASSAYAQVPIDLPSQTRYLQLRYRFVDPGDGDRVTLFLDDLAMWSARGTDHSAGEWITIPTPVRGLDGHHILTIALEGEGAINAVFELGTLSAIVGNGAPTVDAGPDQTFEATGPGGALVTLSPSVSDPDGDGLATHWTGPFGILTGPSLSVTLPLGTHHLTLHASDPTGEIDDDEVVITVRDTTAPSLLGVPAGRIAEATSPSGAAVAWPAPTAQDAVDPAPSVSCAPASGSVFSLGQTGVVCSGTDATGNTTTAGFLVTVRDTTAPTVIPPPDQTAIQAGPTGAVVVYPAPMVTDGGSGVQSSSCAPLSGSTFSVGVTVVTCTATDRAGNSGSATFKVSVTAPPPDGRMFGFGFIDDGGVRHHFAFRVAQAGDKDYGRFEYWANDPRRCAKDDDSDSRRRGDHSDDYGIRHCSTSKSFEATSVGAVTFSTTQSAQTTGHNQPVPDAVRFSGTGRWNGSSGYSYEVVANDKGEPGRSRDRFSLIVRNSRGTVVTTINDVLDGGNIESLWPRR